MSSVILVPFNGPGTGVADLSWGQREIWSAMRAQESSLAGGSVAPMPDGKGLDYAASLLSYLMGRYPSFRTRLRFEPDGTIRQVLSDRGEVPMHIVDAPDDADPARFAEAVRVEYVDRIFDYADEWPIRMAVVRQHGQPTHLVAVHCHLALDGGGFQAIATSLLSYDETANVSVDDADPAQEPLDQVRWQQGPAGLRHHAMVERHWRKLLARVASNRFGHTDDERQPRHWRVTGRSAAAHVAMRAIAARVGQADTSPVLMAAIAVALAQVTGISPTVLKVIVNNRFRPGLAMTASPVAQSALCAIDVAGATFDETVDRAWRSLMSAYLNAYYDPDRMADAIAEIGRERGMPMDLDCYFNDRRDQSSRELTGSVPTEDELRSAARLGPLTWGPHSDAPSPRFYVHVIDVPDAIELLVFADTRYVPPADLGAFFGRFEEVLVESAFDPTVRTGVPAAEPAQAGRP
ncbi:MAG TPA: condensation domain-containing protein [Pseudonocardiaceae bacterium]|nr:condensation domain-containing protein [Pseudonocardiaceae bacterium]